MRRDASPERVIELQPTFPIPGPNAVRRVRVAPDRVAALVAEVEATFAAARLPFVWELDDETEPPDLGHRLEGMGYRLGETLACLVLELSSPAGRELARRPWPPGVAIEDGLRTRAAYDACEEVNRLAFGAGADPSEAATAERYRLALAGPRRLCLARFEGRPAGTGWATPLPEGTHLNGGGVAPEFQRRGVYGALLRARAEIAVAAASPGLATLARSTSEPILRRLGFVEVGRLRHYVR